MTLHNLAIKISEESCADFDSVMEVLDEVNADSKNKLAVSIRRVER